MSPKNTIFTQKDCVCEGIGKHLFLVWVVYNMLALCMFQKGAYTTAGKETANRYILKRE